jgi:small subunit ribosomal protein S1
VDAKVTSVDAKSRKVALSIKAREVEEEKRAMAEFGSSDSGASLGDILGAAISKAQKAQADKTEGEEPAAKPKGKGRSPAKGKASGADDAS